MVSLWNKYVEILLYENLKRNILCQCVCHASYFLNGTKRLTTLAGYFTVSRHTFCEYLDTDQQETTGFICCTERRDGRWNAVKDEKLKAVRTEKAAHLQEAVG